MLCPDIETDGFDPQRCQCGYVIWLKDKGRIAKLIDYNENLGGLSNLMPPIFASIVEYEALGSQHMTISLRLFKSGKVSPIKGRAFKSPDDDDLTARITHGSYFICLSDDIPEDDARFLARWQNADQDKNQASSDQSLMRTIREICKVEVAKCPLVKLSQIAMKVVSTSLIKLKVDAVGTIAKYVLEQGDYVDEVMNYCSMHINAKELAISPAWFGYLSSAFGKDRQLLKLNTHLIHLDPKCVIQHTRPSPDICRSIAQSDMNTLMRTPERADEVEDLMKENRQLVIKIMTKRNLHSCNRRLYSPIRN